MTETPTLWRAWLREALNIGVAPHEFWRLSVREWRFAMDASPQRLAQDELLALMARFPDHMR